jgi:hypothetical protein
MVDVHVLTPWCSAIDDARVHSCRGVEVDQNTVRAWTRRDEEQEKGSEEARKSDVEIDEDDVVGLGEEL